MSGCTHDACSYSFYLAVMYIMFILLLAVVALSAYVGWNVQNNRLEHSWWVQGGDADGWIADCNHTSTAAC
jgi:hypothetical protein